jgi:uncharacterized protein (TIGR03118 family)
MRMRWLACLFASVIIGGCSSSNNKPADAGKDGAKDTAATDTSTVDMAPGDTPVGDTTPPNDVVSGDAPDSGLDVAPGSTTQKLSMTVIVTDQIGGDGGLEVAPSDAGAGDADGGVDGGDAGAVTTPSVDPNLVNPWGLAINPTGPIWVADNHTGLSTVYNAAGQVMSLVVTVPVGDGGTAPSAPTGLVFNATTGFQGDKFIFSTEDGTVSGWQSGTVALLRVDNTAASSVYKGLTLMTQNAVSRIYATDFHNGKVDVFDQTYAKITAAGGFTDANPVAGYAPFGIQAIGSTIYVTYAKQDDMKMDDMSGPGNGYVDAFDFDGHFMKRVISQGALNSPWAVALAPSDFGAFSGALLVGNFGDGHIGAYNASTGVFLGAALTTAGAPLAIQGLWALVFGNDTAGAAHNRLFFTAGPHDESHGLLGHLDLP